MNISATVKRKNVEWGKGAPRIIVIDDGVEKSKTPSSSKKTLTEDDIAALNEGDVLLVRGERE